MTGFWDPAVTVKLSTSVNGRKCEIQTVVDPLLWEQGAFREDVLYRLKQEALYRIGEELSWRTEISGL